MYINRPIYKLRLNMKDNFKYLLKQFRIEHNLSQNNFVDLFLSSGDYLSKLDTVTLSRWENGKTIPSIEKKISIMRILNLLTPYIYSIHDFEIPTKINSSLNIRFGIEWERYKKLNKTNTTSNIKFEHVDHRDNLQQNIKKYLINETQQIINIIPSLPLSVGHWISNDNIEAFFIHAFSNNKIYSSNEINSIIILEQVTSSIVYYKLCILCLFNALLYNNKLDYIFIHINTKYILKLALSIGFNITNKINDLSAPPNEDMNLKFTHVLKIETNKLLSNKEFLFFCLQSRINIRERNPKLLEKIDEIYI